MRTLNQIAQDYMVVYQRAFELKTRKAQLKNLERCEDLRHEFWGTLSEVLEQGDVLTGARFGITGIIGGAGVAHADAKLTVLDVYTHSITVSIPTSEYPQGEVFRVDFLDGWMGQSNLKELMRVKGLG